MALSSFQLHALVYLPCLLCVSLIPLARANGTGAGSGGGVYGGRHSYSLSTFSPSGDIDQVARAMRASMLGVPIVAIAIPPIDEIRETSEEEKPALVGETESVSDRTAKAENSSPSDPLPSQGGIYVSIPLRFLESSPFLIDDGTPRIVQITSSSCVTHTGVGADGRALCDIAVKLALDYRYIYGEEISVEELLEGLSEKVQEMTMRAGSRPFGCALLVGCLGSNDSHRNRGPAMYRVDPSGAVVLLNSFHREHPMSNKASEQESIRKGGQRGSVALIGNWETLRQKKDGIRNQLENHQFTSEDELRSVLINTARQIYMKESPLRGESPLQSAEKRRPVLFASFTCQSGLQISLIK